MDDQEKSETYTISFGIVRANYDSSNYSGVEKRVFKEFVNAMETRNKHYGHKGQILTVANELDEVKRKGLSELIATGFSDAAKRIMINSGLTALVLLVIGIGNTFIEINPPARVLVYAMSSTGFVAALCRAYKANFDKNIICEYLADDEDDPPKMRFKI